MSNTPDIDPRIAGLFSGIVLLIVGFAIPSDFDIASKMTDDLKVAMGNYEWCGENKDCKNTQKIAINNLETSLNTINLYNNLTVLFLLMGFITSGGSGYALVKP